MDFRLPRMLQFHLIRILGRMLVKASQAILKGTRGQMRLLTAPTLGRRRTAPMGTVHRIDVKLLRMRRRQVQKKGAATPFLLPPVTARVRGLKNEVAESVQHFGEPGRVTAWNPKFEFLERKRTMTVHVRAAGSSAENFKLRPEGDYRSPSHLLCSVSGSADVLTVKKQQTYPGCWQAGIGS